MAQQQPVFGVVLRSPKVLVGLSAPQEIDLGDPLIDRLGDDMDQQGLARAQPPEGRVEPAEMAEHPARVGKGVEDGDDAPVEPQGKKAQGTASRAWSTRP